MSAWTECGPAYETPNTSSSHFSLIVSSILYRAHATGLSLVLEQGAHETKPSKITITIPCDSPQCSMSTLKPFGELVASISETRSRCGHERQRQRSSPPTERGFRLLERTNPQPTAPRGTSFPSRIRSVF